MTSPHRIHPLANDAYLRRRLIARARHGLGHENDAEDLVQDTYLRTAHAELPPALASREVWLFTVMRHLSIDAWRRQGRHRDALTHVVVDGVYENDGERPERLAEQAQRVDDALTYLVRTLPPGDVAMWLLYEVWDFTHAELGALAGRSAVASRQRLHRLQLRLQEDPGAQASDDDDDSSCLIELCRQALGRRDPAGLVAVLRVARPQGIATSLQAICVEPAGNTTCPQAELVQVDGLLGLRVQLGDGPVTWLPLGEAVSEFA